MKLTREMIVARNCLPGHIVLSCLASTQIATIAEKGECEFTILVDGVEVDPAELFKDWEDQWNATVEAEVKNRMERGLQAISDKCMTISNSLDELMPEWAKK